MSSEPQSRYERRTWPQLKRLATEVPEAGIHLQSEQTLSRPDHNSILKQNQNAASTAENET